MQAAVGYLRVSTREQGRGGLGLAAQRHDIEAFGAREGSQLSLGIKTSRRELAGMRYYSVRGSRARSRRPARPGAH
jgi:DNA invertase Pin-like site-specific DNA recombinase